MDAGRYINPYTDFGFKKLFGTEMNKDLLISFLNALFNGREQEITDVEYLNAHSFPGRKIWDAEFTDGILRVELPKADAPAVKHRIFQGSQHLLLHLCHP